MRAGGTTGGREGRKERNDRALWRVFGAATYVRVSDLTRRLTEVAASAVVEVVGELRSGAAGTRRSAV